MLTVNSPWSTHVFYASSDDFCSELSFQGNLHSGQPWETRGQRADLFSVQYSKDNVSFCARFSSSLLIRWRVS